MIPLLVKFIFDDIHPRNAAVRFSNAASQKLAPIMRGGLSARLIFVCSRFRGLRGNILSTQGALVAMLTAINALAIDATLVREISLESLLPVGADALQASPLVFAAVLAVMTDFSLGLTNSRMAKATVDVLRGGAPDCAGCSRLGRLLAMAPFNIGI